MVNYSIQGQNINLKSDYSEIAILGKGSNLHNELASITANALKIGLNDTHKIYTCDINLIKDEWAMAALNSPDNHAWNILRYSEISEDFLGKKIILNSMTIGDNFENFFKIFNNSQPLLGFFGVNVFNALILAKNIKCNLDREIPIRLYGFNFDYKKSLLTGFEDVRADAETVLSFQKEVMDFVVTNNTDVDYATSDRQFDARSDIQYVQNDGHELMLVAEITTNHFGERKRLESLIRAAKAQGATHVKFQRRDVDTFYSNEKLAEPYKSPFGRTFREYRMGLELSDDDFVYIDELCKALKIDWFISALDEYGFTSSLKFERNIVKLPSTISNRVDYLKYVADNYSGGVIISTGMTDQAYEHWILNTFENNSSIYMLQCNSAYPTPRNHCNLAVIKRYAELSKLNDKIIPGYSSHDNGNLGCQIAIACGAKMIEKHVKYGPTDWAHFDSVALDLKKGEFRKFVDDMVVAVDYLGSSEKHITSSEYHKYE